MSRAQMGGMEPDRRYDLDGAALVLCALLVLWSLSSFLASL
jgi:hypothetical protein